MVTRDRAVVSLKHSRMKIFTSFCWITGSKLGTAENDEKVAHISKNSMKLKALTRSNKNGNLWTVWMDYLKIISNFISSFLILIERLILTVKLTVSIGTHQCDQIWRYLPTLATFHKFLGISLRSILYLATILTYFDKFLCCWVDFRWCKWPNVDQII